MVDLSCIRGGFLPDDLESTGRTGVSGFSGTQRAGLGVPRAVDGNRGPGGWGRPVTEA